MSHVSLGTTLPTLFNVEKSGELKKRLFPGILLALILIGILIILNSIYNSPNATIVINQQGLSNHQVSQLRQTLGEEANGSFYRVDLDEYREKALSLSWVNQVDIRRDWQQGIIVTAIPRQAVAKFGSSKLVDANGYVFTPADEAVLTDNSLVKLQGDASQSTLIMEQTKQIAQWFRPAGLEVSEVVVMPRMTWIIVFNNGLKVYVDKQNTSEKLYRLSTMLQHKNQLKNLLPQLQHVDLRYQSNRMVIKLKGQTQEQNLTI